MSGRSSRLHRVNRLCNRDPELFVVPRLPITSGLLSYLLSSELYILRRNRTFSVDFSWNVRIPAEDECDSSRFLVGRFIMLPR